MLLCDFWWGGVGGGFFFFFFFNDTATTEIYTLSLHDALPISLSQLICLVLPLGLKSSQWAYILPFGLNGKYVVFTQTHTIIDTRLPCLSLIPELKHSPFNTILCFKQTFRFGITAKLTEQFSKDAPSASLCRV